MIAEWSRVLEILEDQGRVARVVVVATRGSTPREIGASLLVRRDLGFRGTIGGGALEWRALRLAWQALGEGDAAVTLHDVVLGPDLGQCCGGRVTLGIEVLDASDLATVRRLAAREAEGPFFTEARIEGRRLVRDVAADPGAPGLRADGTWVERFGDDRRPLFLFGAGHVGRALTLALAPLPFRVEWIDGRDDAFPAAHPANATCRVVPDPVAAFAGMPAGAFVLAMTHDHALDLAIVDAALRRPDLPHVGVIGSKTKRARFVSRLLEMGHTEAAIRRMVMPVGAGGPRSKSPAVIAAAVALELLVLDEAARETDRETDRAASRASARMSGVGA